MQQSPPIPPCGCHEATLQLRSNISVTSNTLHPSTTPSALQQHPSPSLALLQGRAISEHWTRITSCPHSSAHLFSPTILRCTTRTMRRIITQYEFFIKHMLNTGPPPYTTQDRLNTSIYHRSTYHFTQYDEDAASTTSTIPPENQHEMDLPLPTTDAFPISMLFDSDSTSFIGNQPLEDDEASILFQEGVRQSILQMSAIMRDVQRAIDNRRLHVEYERRRRQMDRMEDDDGEGMDEGDSEEEGLRTGEDVSLARLPDVREMGVLTMRAYELFGALDELARREI